MATIDVGKLTFNHKGDYSSSTAYVLNDVVYYNGSAYIAKQATTNNVPTNATYWNLFVLKGTDTSVLTTQGDVLYHTGSALARLPAGTSGQFLKTQGSGANPTWSDVGGGLLQYKVAYKKGRQSITSTSGVAITDTEVSLTPASASNKILVRGVVHFGGNTNLYESLKLYRKIASGSYAVITDALGDADGGATRSISPMQMVSAGNPEWKVHTTSFEFLDAPNTTSQVYYQLYAGFNNDNLRINEEENSSNGSYDSRPLTTISISELSSTIL